MRYIEGDMPPTEYAQWLTNFSSEPEPLTLSEKEEFLKGLDGVALASDAFFPFRDSLDVASTRGLDTKAIDDFYSGLAAAQTGGTTMLLDFVIPGKARAL